MKLLSKSKIQKLIRTAKRVGLHAYAPYSGFKVGAAVLTSDGHTYGGCNVENVSYGATCCAERTALYKAVSEGKKKFLAIAVVANDKKRPIPCGICRQVLWELAGDLEVVLIRGSDYEVFPLSQIYPQPFQKQKSL